MTTVRLASILAALLMASGCSANEQSNLAGNTSAIGGSAASTVGGSTSTGATTVGGAFAVGAGGKTAISATGGGATATNTAAVVTTRCTNATTGELTLKHTPSAGQSNMLAGTTAITAGSATSFQAADVALKFCFSVVGSVALTATSGMIIDSASISGGSVNYVNLASTPITLETTSEANRYCIVFNVGSAAGASGVTVTGATSVTYNWRFSEKSVDVGLLFDPRPKNAPELTAVLKSSVAACTVVTS